MAEFLKLYGEAAFTTAGLFWMAFWAFGLGYLISAMIQIFVTRERMRKNMGQADIRSVALSTFFGFISSSCSFAALSTTRALFLKGAALVPSLSFLLASTNLVIELGIVIALFFSWQFVVGEYLGGIVLILITWVVVKLSRPVKLEQDARQHARDQTQISEDSNRTKHSITSIKSWHQVMRQYLMEWKMVWKDVTIGFTLAGIIAVFVPQSFFQTLFVGAGQSDLAFWQILCQVLIGPLAAFFTFIGSMGNIPLAVVLYQNGVSFAGIMAFIFSDLVVFPVLRIQAQYYGWKMAFYILGVFLIALVSAALILHYGFAMFDLLPDQSEVQKMTERDFFELNYAFFLNLYFIAMSAFFIIWYFYKNKTKSLFNSKISIQELLLMFVTAIALFWLIGGLFVKFVFGE